jgi:hypothetical protein
VQKQNWYKFKKMLPSHHARRQGVVLVTHEQKILAGAISHKQGAETKSYFEDFNAPILDIEESAEFYSHKYQADTVSVISRDDLMTFLPSVTVIKRQRSPSYQQQLEELKNLLVAKGIHKGDRHAPNMLPRNHFFLDIFDTMFAELLPERKLVLLCIVEENRDLMTLAMEFEGRQLKKYSDPDWSNLDWTQKGMDVFHIDTAQRLTLWAENNYMLPCYSVFVSRRLWNECADLQKTSSNKAAWKLFLQQLHQREAERELLVTPMDWSMKANLRWHGMGA